MKNLKARIDILFHDAGGGHRNAATALQSAVQQKNKPWEVQLVNLQELLDPLDILRHFTGIRIQEGYNLLLRNGWTLGSPYLLRVLQAAIRLQHAPTVKLLQNYWRENDPLLVVSVIPHFNRAIRESYYAVFPERPFVTILTDLADYPPRFWIEAQPQYLVCGTPRAVDQAKALGHRDDCLFRTSGMILNPRFYEQPSLDFREMRLALGLKPDLPTALLLFGGYGSRSMLSVARLLNASRLPVQLIAICGRNERLVSAFRGSDWQVPVHVEGFTPRVNEFMAASDFLIGKPGPGAISEALAMKLPVIVETNAWTLPQERYNAEWIESEGVGMALPSFRDIVPAVRKLIEPDVFAQYRRNVCKLNNRAVFEIPEILDTILHNSGNGNGSSA
ncbi:MAG: galactosyldiacylglycerol synthase [Acidobacteriia bacterium]|nr:galactosyldiacylglycerol synthase [Terriglobia bacterium]